MDIEQYDASDPEKYLKGILHSEQEPWVGLAYQSYLAVLPSSLVGFDDFAKKVKHFPSIIKSKNFKMARTWFLFKFPTSCFAGAIKSILGIQL